MNFDWTESDRELRRQLNAIFDDVAVQELESFEHADLCEGETVIRRNLKRLSAIGYLNIAVGPDEKCEAMKLLAGQEELARHSGSLYLSIEVTARVFGGLLKGFGNNRHFSPILQGLAQGDFIGAVAVTEPACSGEVTSTVACPDGSDYGITGQKDFVTNAPIADYIAVLANVGDRPAFCLVTPNVPGLIIGPRIQTLGYNGLAVSSVGLEDVRISSDMVIGPLESDSALEFLSRTQDLILTMASVGLMERIVSEAKQYSGRHQRVRKPIFDHQEIRFKLAEMLTLHQTAQLLAFRAGWMLSKSHPETATLVHCAKVFASEACERVSSMAMQIMAGQGYIIGTVVERAYREAKYSAIAGTTSEIARMAIAKDLLGRSS